MLKVSESSQVHPKAHLGVDVVVGPHCIIGEHVTIGDGTVLGSHVIVDGWTDIGRDNTIHHFAVLGTPPQDLKWGGAMSHLAIGDRNTIREFATLNRATGEGETTRVGNGNLIMTYVHVAHNCEVGDGVILANAVNLAGHVTIEDAAIVGGVTPVHQFVRIGRHSMIGGGSRIPKDMPPYLLGAGNPMRISGVNLVGLDRRGFSEASKSALKEAYRLLYRSGLNRIQATERIRAEVPSCPELDHLLQFLETSHRGTL